MTETALYRIWSGDELLYIGISYNPWTRYGNHAHLKNWMRSATRMDIEWFADRCAAMTAERLAIDLEKPKFNLSDATGDLKKKVEALPQLSAWIASSGMTQAGFSDLCGINFTAMSRILSGHRHLSVKQAKMVEAATNGEIKIAGKAARKPKSKDADFVSRLASFAADGKSCHQIAEAMNVSTATIHKAAKENEIALHRPKRASVVKDRLIALSQEGLTKSEAARKLGFTYAAVAVPAKKYGINFKSGIPYRKATQ